jgi:hypothetical protein
VALAACGANPTPSQADHPGRSCQVPFHNTNAADSFDTFIKVLYLAGTALAYVACSPPSLGF